MSTNGLRVRYYGLARNAVGLGEDTLQLTAGSTVRQLLDQLVALNGDQFRHSVVTVDGRLRPTAHVLLGDTDIADLDGLETVLEATDTVTIMVIVYPVEGG